MLYVICDSEHNTLATASTNTVAGKIARCLSNTNYLVYTDSADEDFINLYWQDKFIGTLSKRGGKID